MQALRVTTRSEAQVGMRRAPSLRIASSSTCSCLQKAHRTYGLPGLDPVVEHLMGDRDHSAAGGEVSTELHPVGIAQRADVGGHEVRAARHDRLESD